jgi:transcriptional regulator with XRE-family HTH domain
LTVRIYKVAPTPRRYRPGDVKRVRELLGTSQAVLARFPGVNVNTVRSWEQGKRLPQPIARCFLSEIEADPMYWRQRIRQETFGDRAREAEPPRVSHLLVLLSNRAKCGVCSDDTGCFFAPLGREHARFRCYRLIVRAISGPR